MTGSSHEVMHMLADPRRIVSGHDRSKVVLTVRARGQRGAIPVPVQVVQPQVISLPNLDRCVGNGLTASVENPSSDGQRHAGIPRCAQDVRGRSAPLVERTQLHHRRQRADGLLPFPGFGESAGQEIGRGGHNPEGHPLGQEVPATKRH